MIRCVACRGSKVVAKLGGIHGDCNTCDGTGKIKASDKPVPFVIIDDPLLNDIIVATERVVVSSEPVIDTVNIVSPKPVDAFTKPEFVDTVKDTISAVGSIVDNAAKPAMTVTKRKVFSKKK